MGCPDNKGLFHQALFSGYLKCFPTVFQEQDATISGVGCNYLGLGFFFYAIYVMLTLLRLLLTGSEIYM